MCRSGRSDGGATRPAPAVAASPQGLPKLPPPAGRTPTPAARPARRRGPRPAGRHRPSTAPWPRQRLPRRERPDAANSRPPRRATTGWPPRPSSGTAPPDSAGRARPTGRCTPPDRTGPPRPNAHRRPARTGRPRCASRPAEATGPRTGRPAYTLLYRKSRRNSPAYPLAETTRTGAGGQQGGAYPAASARVLSAKYSGTCRRVRFHAAHGAPPPCRPPPHALRARQTAVPCSSLLVVRSSPRRSLRSRPVAGSTDFTTSVTTPTMYSSGTKPQ